MKTITKILLLILFCVSAVDVNAQNFYRSRVSGNWTTPGTWELSTNNGSTWQTSTTTYPTSTAGAVTIQSTHNVTLPADSVVSIDQLVLAINSTITLNASSSMLLKDGAGTDLTMNSGSVITGSGTLKTDADGIAIEQTSTSCFISTPLRIGGNTSASNVNSPYRFDLRGTLTVDTLKTLTSSAGSFTFVAKGDVVNKGTIAGGNSSSAFSMRGSNFVNTGTINVYNFLFDTTTIISGAGDWASAEISINASGEVLLGSNVIIKSTTFSILSGGILNPNTFILTFNGTLATRTFRVYGGGLSTSSGFIHTIGNVAIDLRNSSTFDSRLTIVNGVMTSRCETSPFISYFYNQVTVDAGATFRVDAGSYTAYMEGNFLNNGTVTGGNSSSAFRASGGGVINNGLVDVFEFSFDDNTSISGTGTWGSAYTTLLAGSEVILSSDINFGHNATKTFRVLTGGNLNLNGFTLNLNGSLGTAIFEQRATSTTQSSGHIRSRGTAYLDLYTGSNFLPSVRVNTGTTTVLATSSPFVATMNNLLTIDTGATFRIEAGGYTLIMNDSVVNNGSIASGNTASDFRMFGTHFMNNGTVSAYNFEFESPQAAPNQYRYIQGTGRFTSVNLTFLEGTFAQLLSNHSFAYFTINSGSTLDLNSKAMKITGSGSPLTVNGALITGGSTIEYNGTAAQSTMHSGISYANMTINNPAGVTVTQNFSLPGLLNIVSGDLELNGKVITLLGSGSLSETAGNTVKGNTGYITTTRSINAPNALNIAGLGAVITSSANFGLTEVRRGHTIQTTPGGPSIRRYYVIRPDNNSGLNATCVFKYDESELNSINESSLKMLKSTNAGSTYLVGGGTVNTTQNTVTVTAINDFARHTLGLGLAIANIIAAPEGFYNTTTQRLTVRDTVRIQLRNATSPYAIVDTAKAILDSATLTASVLFLNAPNGSYYVVIKHRNSIETWSKTPQVYNTEASLLYNFTTAQAQAFGDNLKLKGTKWVIYGGDVNQDGAVDATDVQTIDNDAANFESGYVPTDLNGDGFVDGSDFTIGDNNAANFVGKITP